MTVRRALNKRERDALYLTLDVMQKLRKIIVAVEDIKHPAVELRAFDDATEVIRALATDTHSLVREGP